MNERLPETTAELFDRCHELFGIGGSYDPDANPDPPWFKVRMNEIGKLNRILKARRIEVRSMALAAEYCHREGISIKATGELIPHITAALIDYRAEENSRKAQDLYDRINRAASAAIEQGDNDLAERLLRMPIALVEPTLEDVERELGIGS